MSLYRYGATVSCACMATYFINDESDPITYFRVSVLSLLFYLIISLAYLKFIRPFYTGSLRHLPLIPRESWKEGFTLLTPPMYLEAMDNIPNNGLLRRIDMLNQEVIVITQLNLVNEFLQQRAHDYEKVPSIRRILIDILGMGLVGAEGHDHTIQRKAVAPAFGVATIRKLYPLFWTKASEMVSLIKDEINAQACAGLETVVNMENWSARVAIDIIGEAGFGSRFDALTHPFTPLNRGYQSAFIVDASTRLLFLLSFMTSPAFTNLLPLETVKAKKEGKKVVRSWIQETIEERKKDMYHNVDDVDYLDRRGHTDIISAIMKDGTLNTDGLVEQALTFLGAGHETSATALTWGIHELSQPSHIHYQTALRAEIRAALPSPTASSSTTTSITSTLLDSLPLLDAISKEILRLHAPVVTLGRRAQRDTILGGVLIPKHTHVRVSPWAMNQTRSIWGDDARVFRPERWMGKGGSTGGTGESLAAGIVWGHGVRSCIGKGFAQAENKALLAALIGSFEFRQVGNKHVDPVNVWGIVGKILGLEVETRVVEGW